MVQPTMAEADAEPLPNPDQAQARPLFNHHNDEIFWHRIHPTLEEAPTCQDAKTFHNIKRSIEEDFGNTPKLSKILVFMKRYWNIQTDDNTVNVRAFVNLTKHMGSLTGGGNSCTLLSQINKLMSYNLRQNNAKMSPFAMIMTQDEAEDMLRDKDPETYLVRFSESLADQGGYSLAVKANAQDVRHYNILGDPEFAAQQRRYNAKLKLIHGENPTLNAEERQYRDIVHFMKDRLMEVLEDNIFCRRICPNLPHNALFRGYD